MWGKLLPLTCVLRERVAPAADIPESPVLFYTLKGHFDPSIGVLEFEKVYEKVTADLKVKYKGTLDTDTADGQPVIKGSWQNELEGTHGTFACRLEE